MDGIDDWIREKLDEGADKDALKQVVEEKGYEPGKVDEVADGDDTGSEESLSGTGDLSGADDLGSEEESGPGVERSFPETGSSDEEPSSERSDDEGFDTRDIALIVVLFAAALVAGLLLPGL